MEKKEPLETGSLEGIPDYTGPGVYRIVNTRSGKIYVGSSKNVKNRILHHISKLKHGKHHCKELQRDFDNGDTLSFEIACKIHVMLKAELRQREHEEMRKYSSHTLYNSAHFDSNQYVSQYTILWQFADRYCREHAGTTIGNFLKGNVAEFNMRYLLFEKPEMEAEIRKAYEPAIEYLNKKSWYSSKYGVDYDEFLEMTPEEQRAVKRKKQ